MLLIKDFVKCVYFFKKINNKFRLIINFNTLLFKYKLILKLDSHAFLALRYSNKGSALELTIFNENIDNLKYEKSIFDSYPLKEIMDKYYVFIDYVNKSELLKKDFYFMMTSNSLKNNKIGIY